MDTTNTAPTTQGPSRRAIAGMAWAVPVVAATIATPSTAASLPPAEDYWEVLSPPEMYTEPDGTFRIEMRRSTAAGAGVDGVPAVFNPSNGIIFDNNVVITSNGGLATFVGRLGEDYNFGTVGFDFDQNGGVIFEIYRG